MISVKELRIGNLVYIFNNREAEVTDVSRHGCWVNLLEPEEMQSLSHKVNNISPIPLTEEWLVRLGWEWNERTNSYERTPNEKEPHGAARMHLEFRAINGSYKMFNYVLKAIIAERIWYVHQLQNLYFALTGKELIIAPTN